MILIHRICLLLVASAASIATCPSWLCGDEPLSRRIDRAITDAHVGPLSPLANDYEFARRVHLDFVGRSPSIDEVRSFVTDTDPEKRRELIDRLLASTEFDKYFARALDITLMERRGGARISQTQWMKFLRDAVSQQWPLDRIVQQVIRADGKDGSRGAAKFLIEREVEPNALTRDIGRIFFGRDLQCAQCHDHPNIADYTQGEYYGIYAFVDRSYLFEDPKDNKKSYVGEKADGDPQFKSVFEPDADDSTATPSLLSGLTLEIEPPLGSDDAYVVPPSKSAAAVPTFSRRAQLARLITHPANQHFARNMANRLWAHLMGRGLVHPLDFHHSDNPPTHPALLQMLADEFAASGFDYRELLRQIAQSDAYQRSIDMPEELPTSLADLEAQQAELKQSLANLNKPSDSQLGEYQQDLERRRQRLAEADAAIAELTGESAAIDANRAELEKSLAAAKKQLATQQKQVTALNQAVAAAKQVSELSPDEKSLAAALADYQQRAAAATERVKKTQAEIDAKQKALAALPPQQQELQVRLAKLQGERMGIADMVAEARGALSVYRERQLQLAARRGELERQLAALKLHRESLQARAAVPGLAAEKEALASAALPLRQQLQNLVASLEPLQTAMAEQEAVVARLRQQVQATIAELDKQQQQLTALATALATTAAAAEQLGGGPIGQAVEILRQQQAKLERQITATTQQRDEQQQQLQASETALSESQAQVQQLVSKREGVQKQLDQSIAKLDAATEKLQAAVAEAELADARLRQSWQQRYAVRSVIPLTPEQLAGSTITALELLPRFQREAEAEWQQQQDKKEDKSGSEVDEAAKAKAIAALKRKRIDAVYKAYVALFAAPGGAPQDVFSATADQALFVANDGRVQSWLAPAEGTLLHRLQSIEEADAVAEELYLSILTRSPTNQEREAFVEYLASRPDQRGEVLKELAWGLLSSLEFRFKQ